MLQQYMDMDRTGAQEYEQPVMLDTRHIWIVKVTTDE